MAEQGSILKNKVVRILIIFQGAMQVSMLRYVQPYQSNGLGESFPIDVAELYLEKLSKYEPPFSLPLTGRVP